MSRTGREIKKPIEAHKVKGHDESEFCLSLCVCVSCQLHPDWMQMPAHRTERFCIGSTRPAAVTCEFFVSEASSIILMSYNVLILSMILGSGIVYYIDANPLPIRGR